MAAKRTKKKKSIFRRLLKWTGIFLVLLILALILIPILFKDQLKEMAVNEVNKMLEADVSLGDFDLTLISTFPNLTVTFNDVSVTGRNDFAGVKLADIKQFDATVGLWDVVSGDQISVTSVNLIEPNIDVRVLENGKANYDIAKADSTLTEEEAAEPSNFKFSLNSYTITDGNVSYVDDLGNMKAILTKLNHTGKGDLTANDIDFETETQIEELTYEMDGIGMLYKVKTDAKVNILMNFTDATSKFTIKDNELKLNNLTLAVDGYYEMLEGYDEIDMKLDASKTSFKDLLSLIPTFYQSGYESMVTKGSLSLDGMLKGKITDTDLPAWDFGMNVSNAEIAYPDLPAKINNIDIVAGSKFSGGSNLDKMTIDVDKFKAEFVGNTLDANLHVKNVMTDPYLKAKIMADVDLATLDQVMPVAEGESYTGKLKSNLEIDGKLSALENEDYVAFKAGGGLSITDLIYNSPDFTAPINVNDLALLFNPQNVTLSNLDAKVGSSDFKMNGTIDNFMGYLFNENEALKGNFTYNSTNLNLDELAALPKSTGETAPVAATGPAETEPTVADPNAEPILVPENIDFKLNSTIGKMTYDGLVIDDIDGQVHIHDQIAELSNLTMKTMGGTVGVDGAYNTQNHQKPKVDFAYKLKSIDINPLVSNFLAVEKLMPVAKYAQGLLDSEFKMTTELMPDLSVDYNTLAGEGFLFTDDIQIAGFKPMEKLADALKIDKIKNSSFKDVRANFEFAEGKVRVKPFNVNIAGIRTDIDGTTSFEQDIDYNLQMNIPKSMVPQSMLKLAEEGIKQVNKLPGFEMKELPALIPVKGLITNKVTDPKVQTNFKESIMELAGDIKGAAKDFVDDKINQAKDSIKNVVNDKVDDVKDDLEERRQKILSDAQVQADKVKAEGKKAADLVRKEAAANAQKLIDEAGSNPIKKKVAEKAAEKLIKEGEEKAQKLENTANSKADGIMQTARDKSDKLQ